MRVPQKTNKVYRCQKRHLHVQIHALCRRTKKLNPTNLPCESSWNIRSGGQLTTSRESLEIIKWISAVQACMHIYSKCAEVLQVPLCPPLLLWDDHSGDGEGPAVACWPLLSHVWWQEGPANGRNHNTNYHQLPSDLLASIHNCLSRAMDTLKDCLNQKKKQIKRTVYFPKLLPLNLNLTLPKLR